MLHLIDIAKAYGAQELFTDLSWHIGAGKRIGLVGRNGSGKTTLFRLITGEEIPDHGEVVHAKHVRIGYLVQEADVYGTTQVLEIVTEAASTLKALEAEKAALEEQMSAGAHAPETLERYANVSARYDALGGYEIETEARKILGGLGFSTQQMESPCSTLSGGWLMRVGLARLLLTQPDLLLLDEPSNHLDLETLTWFEDYTLSYPGTIVFISHDRALLNRLPTEIAELGARRITTYVGNYDAYQVARAEREVRAVAAHARGVKEAARAQAFIYRFRAKASKAKAVQSRVKRLDKMDIPDAPESEQRTIRFGFERPPRSGKEVLVLDSIAKRFGDGPAVYEGVDLTLRRGDRVALVGPNGAGKTTLLRIMADALPIDGGECRLGPQTLRAYYAQHQAEALNAENTVLQELEGVAEIDVVPRIRGVLGALGFSGETVDKKIMVLSGGEKARVALAKMLLKPANLLLLDEPTNHLDLPSCMVLEEALRRYEGTLVLVSHDRAFINALVTEIVEVGPRELIRYPGNVDYYTQKRRESAVEARPASAPTTSGSELKRRKRLEAELRNAKHRQTKALRSELGGVETRVASVETEVAGIEAEMLEESFYANADAMQATYERKAALDKELEMLLERWEEIGVEIEAIEHAIDAAAEQS